MCGRYYRKSDKQRIAEAFRIGDFGGLESELAPSYNVAPQTFQPVVRLDQEGNREIAMMRWGLVPFWAKESKPSFTTINARCETVATSGMYKESFKRRRCLVPADGFFEWQKLDAKNKQPFAFSVKSGRVMGFAGIWDSWHDKAADIRLETFSIITTEPNEMTVDVHDRMPVILSPADYARWLEPGDPQQPPIDLLRPMAAEDTVRWPVARDVGNVRNNRQDLIVPIQ